MSFKEISDNLSIYLLWKYPPKCVFEFEKLLSNFDMDLNFYGLNQSNIDVKCSDWSYEVNENFNLAECYV